MERVQKPMQSLLNFTGPEGNGSASGPNGDLGQDPNGDAQRLRIAACFTAVKQANSVPLRVVMARFGYQINEQTKKTRCPFHSNGRERTPSFYWFTDTNKFKCYGCGRHGDVVEFVALHDNLYRSEAAVSIISYHTDNIDTSVEVKKYVHEDIEPLMAFSDGIRVFLHSHQDDPDAIVCAETICATFDQMRADENCTIKNLKTLVEKILRLLEKYK